MFCSSCGRELPDGSKFCSGCGMPIETNESNSQGEFQQTYSQQTYDNSAYSYNDYTYQQPQNSQKNDYIAYKKKVAPFKIIAAVINLLTTFTLGFMALAYIGVGAGVEGMEIVETVDPGLTSGFMVCGFAMLIFSAIMLIMSIVAMIIPAKAGVISNLIFTIICFVMLIWSVILNIDLGGVANKLNPYGFSTESSQLVSDMAVGLYVFIFLNAAGQFISFILSVIGMMFKKNK